MKWRRYLYIAAAASLLIQLPLTGRSHASERQVDPAAELVASMLTAYGGAEAIGKVLSVTAKGHITEFLNGTAGKAGSYARYLERPGKLRIEVMPEQGGEIRILNGDAGWQWGEGEFVPVSPLELQSMIYQFSYLDLPMALADGSVRVRNGGKQRYKGRDVYQLLIELRNAPQLRILVDAETRLISRVAASFATGMMGAGELSTEYHDFRPVGGVEFPFRLTNFAGDMELSVIRLDEIDINRKIPAKLFAPR